jgi:prepilin-type N-terminal cleavage/methylation domain-containing protein
MTLPEVLLVVAVIGIVAVIAIPNISGMMRVLRTGAAVNEMTSMIGLARQRAVGEREAHLFFVQAAPINRWRLVDSDGDVLQEETLPDGVSITTAASFAFDSRGACMTPTIYTGTTPTSQFLQVQAQISSSRTDRYTIEVSPVGRVKTTRERLES